MPIVHSEQDQNTIFNGLIDELTKQGGPIPAPQIPGTMDMSGGASSAQDNSSAKPAPTAKITDATSKGAVAKLPVNTVTNAIANQGQLLPIPQITQDSNQDGLKEIKQALSKISGDTSASADAAAQPAKSDSGGGLDIGGLVENAALAFIGWIICTELMLQGKMPRKWWIKGAPIFAAYPNEVKQGYYLWAIPCVVHLRSYPNSILSRLLCVVFNCRAQSIAEKATIRGRAITVVLWPICYAIGYVLIRMRKLQNWQSVYEVKQ